MEMVRDIDEESVKLFRSYDHLPLVMKSRELYLHLRLLSRL